MTKKYILKPGKHQFAPSSAAVHSNDNLTDEEAKWYLEKYPHIVSLFAALPLEGEVLKSKEESVKGKKTKVIPNSLQNDSLNPPSGGEEGDI